MGLNKDFIAGLFNFFIWGSGYLYKKDYLLGTLWLIAFLLSHLPMFYLDIEFYQKTLAGTSLFMGHLTISTILLYRGLKHEAKSAKCWQCIKENWHIFLIGTIIAGLISEFANVYLVAKWWDYHPPWTLYGIFSSAVSLPLIAGWLLMVGIALLFSYLLTEHSKIRFFAAWLISWVIIGFAFETFNSLSWKTWHYPDNTVWRVLDLPGLEYGIFVPFIGYGGTGVFTYLGYLILSKLIKK